MVPLEIVEPVIEGNHQDKSCCRQNCKRVDGAVRRCEHDERCEQHRESLFLS